MIAQLADTGLDDDGLLVKTGDDSARIDDMVVLKDANGYLALHSLFEILISQQSTVMSHNMFSLTT